MRRAPALIEIDECSLGECWKAERKCILRRGRIITFKCGSISNKRRKRLINSEKAIKQVLKMH